MHALKIFQQILILSLSVGTMASSQPAATTQASTQAELRPGIGAGTGGMELVKRALERQAEFDLEVTMREDGSLYIIYNDGNEFTGRHFVWVYFDPEEKSFLMHSGVRLRGEAPLEQREAFKDRINSDFDRRIAWFPMYDGCVLYFGGYIPAAQFDSDEEVLAMFRQLAQVLQRLPELDVDHLLY